MIFVLVANLIASLITALMTLLFALLFNGFDILESGNWVSTSEEKLMALFKGSIISTLILFVSVALITLCNRKIWTYFPISEISAKKWTFFFALLAATSALMGAACFVIIVFRGT